MPDDKLKKQLLREEVELLGKAVETLNLSIKKSMTAKFGKRINL